MEIEELEVYSRESNYAVIKPPGRNYPGAVIQGDSLKILAGMANHIAKEVSGKQMGDSDFRDDVYELNNALLDRLLHYQEVLQAHSIQLPYTKAFSQSDLFDFESEE